MFPFFNPGAVNSNGNNQSSAPMQQQQLQQHQQHQQQQHPQQQQQQQQHPQQQQQPQPMMNPSNFPPNPTQFQQQTTNPQMSAPPFSFPAVPYQQAPMNFNQIAQNPAQLLNPNILLALGLGVAAQMQQGINPFLQMPMTMPNFNGQGPPGGGTSGNVNMPQNPMMGFGRPPLPMNSNVPNQMQNTSQQGIGAQAFAPLPIQNSLQNSFQQGVAGQPQGNNTNPPHFQGNNTNPPQGLNNQLGGSRQNNFQGNNTNPPHFQGNNTNPPHFQGNTNPPQGLNNQLARNTNQPGSHNGFSKQLGQRNPNFQKFQTKGGNNDGRKPPYAKNVKAPAVKRCFSIGSSQSRSFPLNYTEQEIKQWREERQKNFPTKANIEKLKEKKKDPEISKNEAALRCQQLKEILAKQAELGCEVAEIPPSYLSVPGADNGRAFNENDRRVRFKQNDESFHNNRRPWKQNDRGRHNPSYDNHQQNNRFSKRPWQMNSDSGSRDEDNKRGANLLKKLHETDIRRDKRHLLQVFRTMVMNSFFKDFPEKPLKFPEVVVRDMGNEVGILGETEEAVDDDEDGANVEGENQEEGEITD